MFDSAFFGFGTLLCVVMIITMLSGFDWDFKTKITLFPLSIACTVLFILDLLTLIKLKTCNFHMKRVKLKGIYSTGKRSHSIYYSYIDELGYEKAENKKCFNCSRVENISLEEGEELYVTNIMRQCYFLESYYFC